MKRGVGGERNVVPLRRALETTLEAKPAGPPDVARVDGKRVVLEGYDEVELRCGKASITLRRNGKVVIRGTEIESYSTGLQRIKGASVKVN